jgi:hypothetical protein
MSMAFNYNADFDNLLFFLVLELLSAECRSTEAQSGAKPRLLPIGALVERKTKWFTNEVWYSFLSQGLGFS